MLLILIASTLVCSTAASEFSLSVPKGSVSEPLGSSAVLPCGLFPSLNAETFEIRWHRNDHNNPVLLYKDLQIQENTGDPQYRRVSLTGELEKGNVSLKLENLTLADAGEYVCYVKSLIWYESATVNLIVKALGSPPLFSLAKAGDQVNVTCASNGWSPKPTLTWRDRGGRELGKSHIHYETDSEGLMSVSSWLLFPSSESEWISCSVGISDQEMVESRVHPVIRLQAWREAFILTLVLSLSIILIIVILTALLPKTLKHKKGLLPQCLSQKNTKATGTGSPVPPGSAEEGLEMRKKQKECKEKPTVETRPASVATTRDDNDKSEEAAVDSGTSSQQSGSQGSKKGRLKCWPKMKKQKEKPTSDTNSGPLTTTQDQKDETQPLTDKSEEANVDSGTSSPVPPGSAEERMKVQIKHKECKEKPTVDTRPASRTTPRDEKVSLPEETQALTADSQEHTPVESHLDTDNTKEAAVDSGTGSPVPPGSAEERTKIWNKHKERKEKLTTDPDARHRSLTTTREGTGVYLGQPDLYRQNQSDPFPHALSREEFSSGLKYWEVKVKRKLSWCVGVTQKPPTKETLTALCYEVDCGIYTSTDPRTGVPAEGPVTTLGLLLDFKHSLLSFYNVDPPSHLHTFTMENMKNRTYCALISPGSKDTEPVSFQS